ncbi:MAG: BPSS1780 family membrane protein [Burkholderiales bacterium]
MTLQVQKLSVANGLKWIVDGFALFRLRPSVWIALTAIWMLISVALVTIPSLGQLVLYLVTPALGAGMLVGCRALERGHNLEIAHLFAGFRSQPGPLISIGGVYLLGNVITFGAFMMLGGDRIITAALERAADAQVSPPDVPAAPLLSVFLLVPLFMAVVFAPPLVMFQNLPALQAIKASFLGCMANLAPVLLFAVLSATCAMIAMLPYGLGMLVWIPIYAGAVYRGYKALFEGGTPAAPPVPEAPG